MKYLAVAFVFSCLLLQAVQSSGQTSKNRAASDLRARSMSPGPLQEPIPASFFGLLINKYYDMPIVISFGQFRFWDDAASWPFIETANGKFDWTPLDDYLGDLHTQGVDDVFYTLGRTPRWASFAPKPLAICDYGLQVPYFEGSCYLPKDLNPDGTGSNTTWINWVTRIATHVNDPSYLQTHSHIKYWEIWNEFFRSSTVSYMNRPKDRGLAYQGTYAQLVRMTEDARCIITGQGSVNGVTCNAPPIDPTAMIVMPSGAANAPGISQNFLYCNAHPKKGSQCTTGSRGANAVDIINFHLSVPHEPLEQSLTSDIATIQGILQAPELAKPLWSGENSWGTTANSDFTDPDLQAAFVGRYHMLLWSLGIPQEFWYGYDFANEGTLWSPQTGVTEAGAAYQQVYNWMVGATMPSSCFAAGTIWNCPLVGLSGLQDLVAWDTSLTCSNGVCQTNQYYVGTNYVDYKDLAGNTYQITDGNVPLGIKPILIENGGKLWKGK